MGSASNVGSVQTDLAKSAPLLHTSKGIETFDLSSENLWATAASADLFLEGLKTPDFGAYQALWPPGLF